MPMVQWQSADAKEKVRELCRLVSSYRHARWLLAASTIRPGIVYFVFAPLTFLFGIFPRSSSALLALMASVKSGAVQLRPAKPPRVRMRLVDATLVCKSRALDT